MPPLLAGRDLWASYAGVGVLQGVSLAVPPGALAAVVGPNGAGKSTLLRVLAGLHPPDRGSVFLEGREVTGLPAHRLARSGVVLVPEGRGIFRSLTVEDNLRLAGIRGGWTREVARTFPVLGERMRQVAGTLSGGEQQMLALARCLSSDARVVLLDEPSLALAPRLVAEVFEAVEALRSSGRTVILVEQYVARALQMADLVYVLVKGRRVFAGEPGELAAGRSLEGLYLGVGA